MLKPALLREPKADWNAGIAILATPVGIYGSSRTALMRYSTGTILVAVGLINAALGALLWKDVGALSAPEPSGSLTFRAQNGVRE